MLSQPPFILLFLSCFFYYFFFFFFFFPFQMISCSSFTVSNLGPQFPVRVLLVDHDPDSILINETILRNNNYEVTTFVLATEAVAELRRNKEKFDIILCDVKMPDIDGLNLLQIISSETDLPVVLMSTAHETAYRGYINGASDYLLKPIGPEYLINIRRHARVRRENKPPEPEPEPEPELGAEVAEVSEEVGGSSCSNSKIQKRRKGESPEKESSGEGCGYEGTAKKPRLIWTAELHDIFVDAVNLHTPEKAVPKKILEYMLNVGVADITRENVASHLQKYRLHIKKQNDQEHEISSNLPPQSVSLNASKESNFKRSPPIDQLYNTHSVNHHQNSLQPQQHHQHQHQQLPHNPDNKNYHLYRGMASGFHNFPTNPPNMDQQIAQPQINDLWALQNTPHQPEPQVMQQAFNDHQDTMLKHANFPLINDSLYPQNLSQQFSNINQNEVHHPITSDSGDLAALFKEMMHGTPLTVIDDCGYNHEGFTVDGHGNDSVEPNMYVSDQSYQVYNLDHIRYSLPNPNAKKDENDGGTRGKPLL